MGLLSILRRKKDFKRNPDGTFAETDSDTTNYRARKTANVDKIYQDSMASRMEFTDKMLNLLENSYLKRAELLEQIDFTPQGNVPETPEWLQLAQLILPILQKGGIGFHQGVGVAEGLISPPSPPAPSPPTPEPNGKTMKGFSPTAVLDIINAIPQKAITKDRVVQEIDKAGLDVDKTLNAIKKIAKAVM